MVRSPPNQAGSEGAEGVHDAQPRCLLRLILSHDPMVNLYENLLRLASPIGRLKHWEALELEVWAWGRIALRPLVCESHGQVSCTREEPDVGSNGRWDDIDGVSAAQGHAKGNQANLFSLPNPLIIT